MDDPTEDRGASVPDELVGGTGVVYGLPGGTQAVERVAHWHDGLGWQQMRTRVGEVLTYICVVDGCDYQLSRTPTE